MAGIWVYADKLAAVQELLTVGRELADTMGTKLTVLAAGDEEKAQDLIAGGADEVLLLPPLGERQPVQDYVPVIAAEAKECMPDVFLISADLVGKEMAARIAARLDTGLCSECNHLEIDKDGQLIMERMVFGGAGIQTVYCSSRPQMATIPVRTYEPAHPCSGREGAVRKLAAPVPSGVTVIEKRGKDNTERDIRNARVIVCAGRGLEAETDLGMLKELAGILGGEVACTRPISEEKHWMGEEACIGLSAQEVKPGLYLGVGVSGQIQHLVGFRESGIICAINCDEKAPIFQSADYGIQGDLYQVLPMLIEELKK